MPIFLALDGTQFFTRGRGQCTGTESLWPNTFPRQSAVKTNNTNRITFSSAEKAGVAAVAVGRAVAAVVLLLQRKKEEKEEEEEEKSAEDALLFLRRGAVHQGNMFGYADELSLEVHCKEGHGVL